MRRKDDLVSRLSWTKTLSLLTLWSWGELHHSQIPACSHELLALSLPGALRRGFNLTLILPRFLS